MAAVVSVPDSGARARLIDLIGFDQAMIQEPFGRYRLLAELGQGGMAQVFLAVLETTEVSGFSKLQVIKRIRGDLLDDPAIITMFLDEARLAARLNHPNVVQTNEVGVVDEHYFIAMEYLDGQPLHRIQRRAQKAHRDSSHFDVLVLHDALAGLNHAHELRDYDGTPLSVVHRDVNPQNLFVTYDGHVKVVDFGIAKATRRATQTAEGIVKGKIRYMAPEQLVGTMDRRADLFAVGVMLWEVLTKKPFWGTTDDVGIALRLVQGDFDPSPRAVAPDLPPFVDEICARALARDPRARYATALEFQQDLHKLLALGPAMPTHTELGALVSELFADKRAAVSKVIETQLQSMRIGEGAPVRLRLDDPNSTSSQHGPHGTPEEEDKGSDTRLVHMKSEASPSPTTSNSALDSPGSAQPITLPSPIESMGQRSKWRWSFVPALVIVAGAGVVANIPWSRKPSVSPLTRISGGEIAPSSTTPTAPTTPATTTIPTVDGQPAVTAPVKAGSSSEYAGNLVRSNSDKVGRHDIVPTSPPIRGAAVSAHPSSAAHPSAETPSTTPPTVTPTPVSGMESISRKKRKLEHDPDPWSGGNP